MEVQDIKVWNNLKGYTIGFGQKLLIKKEAEPLKKDAPSPSYVTYKVKIPINLSEKEKQLFTELSKLR